MYRGILHLPFRRVLTASVRLWYNCCETVALYAQVKQGEYRFSEQCINLAMKLRARTAKGAMKMGFLSVLLELLGEAVHIISLDASFLGALLSTFIDRIKSRRK